MKEKVKKQYSPCPACGKANQTVFDLIYITDCSKCGLWRCQLVSQKYSSHGGEWTRHSNAEKEEFGKDVLQPLTKNGNVNRKFIQAHGTKTLEKELKMSKEEILKQADRYGE